MVDEDVKTMSMHELWMKYRRLVYKLSARWWPGLGTQDKIQEGYFAMLKARENFDPSFNVPFHNYLPKWIYQRINGPYAARMAWPLKLPEAVHQRILQEARAYGHGLPPVLHPISMHVFANDGAAHPRFKDPMANTEAEAMERVSTQRLRHIIRKHLTPREAFIIAKYHGLDGPALTLDKLGRLLGLSRERIRQLRNHAMKVLRTVCEELL